jgi:hypothetical protein
MEALYEKFNFPSLEKFKTILKNNDITVSHAEVKKFIDNRSIRQIHKPVHNIKEKQKFNFALSPFENTQIDLLDYQKYSKTNKGFNFILILVDVFSRKAYAIPIKNKTPNSVLTGFLTFNLNITSIFHDDGKEYLGVFLKYLNDEDIVNITFETGNHLSLGVIDRFSKTFKNKIEKYMNFNDTVKYCDEVDNLIDAYNNTPHNSLGNITPNDVFKNKKDMKLVQRINLAKMAFNKNIDSKKFKFNVGDKVRTQIKKGTFTKGYTITYSKEIYTINEINDSKATLDDGTIEKLKYLLLVPDGSDEIITNKKNDAERQERINNKLRKVGIIN